MSFGPAGGGVSPTSTASGSTGPETTVTDLAPNVVRKEV
jgi:hypothetical protein